MFSTAQEARLVSVDRAGTRTTAESTEIFGVAQSTVCPAIKRAGEAAA